MSGVWIVPAGWLRARAPNGRQAIRLGLAGGMVPQRPVLVLPTRSREAGHFDVSLHPAPSNGRRRTTEHPRVPPIRLGRVARGDVRCSRTQRTPWARTHVPVPKRSSDVMHDGRSRPPTAPAARGRGAASRRDATWLILPVVICLSQRLSHACLSISNCTVKLRMAH